MAQTKANSARSNGAGSIYASSGYKGVSRRGSKWGWQYNSSSGYFSKGGFDSAAEAAYAYDEFLNAHTGGNADTNQALGLLKPKDILAIREKITARERPRIKKSRALGKSGFKGVTKSKSKKNPYTAHLSTNGKMVYLGAFATAEEAAREYDKHALRYIGADAETNQKLGLLPPIVEPVFDPNKGKKIRSVNNNAVAPSRVESDSANESRLLTPEEERERQIQAARIMAEMEAAELAKEEEPEEQAPAAAAAPEVVSVVEAAPAASQIINEPRTGEHIPALPANPQSLRERAAELMRQAQEAERHEALKHVTQIVSAIAEAVKGYQKAVSDLVDYGADLEGQLSRLQNLLTSTS